MARRVYFDTCALNRPFDDQGQPRIRIEADEEQRQAIEMLCRTATEHVPLSESLGRRARDLRALGLRDLDALHLAAAEQGRCEVLVTTDDRLIAATRSMQPPSMVRVENPVVFELEVFR